MDLLVQPDDGFAPVMAAIKKAEASIDTTIFRFDMKEVQKAFEAAVTRGVQVRALIAHTNSDGEKLLRKLELGLLAAGVTLARTDDDLVRYHGKMLLVDRNTLYLMAFNYTHLDTVRSRSFALVTTERKAVDEALALFEADMTRQPYTPGLDDFVVSPENSRRRLSSLVRSAGRSLRIYDPRLTDPVMCRLLEERARHGVDVRVIGHAARRASSLEVRKLPKLRLHARAIVVDDREAFLGSQSLRKAELDQRRETGLVVRDEEVVARLARVFDDDWSAAAGRKGAKEAAGGGKGAKEGAGGEEEELEVSARREAS